MCTAPERSNINSNTHYTGLQFYMHMILSKNKMYDKFNKF